MLAFVLAAVAAPVAVAGTPGGGGAIAPTGASSATGATGATTTRTSTTTTSTTTTRTSTSTTSTTTTRTSSSRTTTAKKHVPKPGSASKPSSKPKTKHGSSSRHVSAPRVPILVSARCYKVRATVCSANPHRVQATGELVVRGHFLTPGYWVYFPRADAAITIRPVPAPTGIVTTSPCNVGRRSAPSGVARALLAPARGKYTQYPGVRKWPRTTSSPVACTLCGLAEHTVARTL